MFNCENTPLKVDTLNARIVGSSFFQLMLVTWSAESKNGNFSLFSCNRKVVFNVFYSLQACTHKHIQSPRFFKIKIKIVNKWMQQMQQTFVFFLEKGAYYIQIIRLTDFCLQFCITIRR